MNKSADLSWMKVSSKKQSGENPFRELNFPYTMQQLECHTSLCHQKKHQSDHGKEILNVKDMKKIMD